MGKIIRRIIILANVFLAAIMIYFVWSQNTIEKSDVVYTSMEDSTLPLVYPTMFGYEMSALHGYLQEMDPIVARESLIVLPADRMLKMRIAGFSENITAVRYEIRNMGLDQLVERTPIETLEKRDGDLLINLPIQNLLLKDEDYLLHLYVDLPQHETVHFYTRIMWTDNVNIKPMVDLAVEFSNKTLDYDQARDLVTYLESNEMADNSTLAKVTIDSSFSQLTWAGLKVKRVGDIQITLKEIDGIMGQVQVDYVVSHGEGEEESFYEVSDHYTMKWNTQRIFLMDYIRETNQIFSGKEGLYSGKRILLGVINEDQIQVKSSENNNYLAYVVNRDLWFYDQEEEHSLSIFSFRNGEKNDQVQYAQHNLKVVSVTDEGDIYFIVYGYMNKGLHEGQIGTTVYQYSHSDAALTECLFIPANATFELLQQDIQKLSYMGGTDLLYLYLDQTIYAIDINSNEYMVVAENLNEGSYCISTDNQYIAWQDQGEDHQQLINWMNLDDGLKKEIKTAEDANLQVLGFVGHDFIYGLSRQGDQWMIHGRIARYPMYALEIIDEQLNLETRYEHPDKYLTDIEVTDGRIHIERLKKESETNFEWVDQDTIVSNEEVTDKRLDGVGWYASKERGKLYFAQLSEEIRVRSRIKISSPKKITYDQSEVLKMQSQTVDTQVLFYAYERGHLMGVTTDFSEAVNMAYEHMGIVVDTNHRIIWNRVNRRNYMAIENPASSAYLLLQQMENFNGNKYDDDLLLLDGRGCTLAQMLYFVDKGIPVVAYLSSDQYLLICGYDNYNISVYDPADKQTYKMGLQSATEYFENLKNDYFCGVYIR